MNIDKIKEYINQLKNQKEEIKNNYQETIMIEYYDKLINYLENKERELEGQTTIFDIIGE